MAEPAHSRELWDLLLAAFRQRPGNFAEVGRLANCHWRTAKRAWTEGWTDAPWARPIKDILAEELVVEREAERQALEERKSLESLGREARKAAAVQAWQLEGRIVAEMGENILLAVQVQHALLKIARDFKEDLVQLAAAEQFKEMPPAEKLEMTVRLLRGLDTLTRSVSAVSEWNKKHYEAPPAAVEEKGITKEATPQQVAAELLELKAQLERAESYGALRILEGGARESQPG
jgi:hypothetical protein